MSSRDGASSSNKKQKQQMLSEFSENLKLITHFRVSLRELTDGDNLRLLSLLDSETFTNADVQRSLGVSRKKAWLILSRLFELQLLDRHGYTYRMGPGTYDLVGALASSLRELVGGVGGATGTKEQQRTADSALPKLLAEFGPDFVEWAYAKGKIDQTQLVRYRGDLQKTRREALGIFGAV